MARPSVLELYTALASVSRSRAARGWWFGYGEGEVKSLSHGDRKPTASLFFCVRKFRGRGVSRNVWSYGQCEPHDF